MSCEAGVEKEVVEWRPVLLNFASLLSDYARRCPGSEEPVYTTTPMTDEFDPVLLVLLEALSDVHRHLLGIMFDHVQNERFPRVIFPEIHRVAQKSQNILA